MGNSLSRAIVASGCWRRWLRSRRAISGIAVISDALYETWRTSRPGGVVIERPQPRIFENSVSQPVPDGVRRRLLEQQRSFSSAAASRRPATTLPRRARVEDVRDAAAADQHDQPPVAEFAEMYGACSEPSRAEALPQRARTPGRVVLPRIMKRALQPSNSSAADDGNGNHVRRPLLVTREDGSRVFDAIVDAGPLRHG
jgi:hypothetical protein